MTLTSTQNTTDLKPTFWRRVRTFLVVTAFGVFFGFELGAGIAGGWSSMAATLPKCLIGTIGAALLGCWIPVGIYYEGHRFRWVYIVIFCLLTTLLALVIGYSIAAVTR